MGIWSAKKGIDKSRNYGFSWSIAGFIETVIPVCLGEPTWNLDLGFDLASCWQIPMNQHMYPWTSTIPGAFFRQLTTWMVSAGSWRLSELSVPTGCEWFSSEVWLVQDLYCISGWWWLEPWNFIFPYIGNNHSNHPNIYIIIYIYVYLCSITYGIIIPTGELIFFRGVGLNHQPDMVNVPLPSELPDTVKSSSAGRHCLFSELTRQKR